jgi:peptidoglycan/xylan/chitin deacetylase (PgdA/CDA1 family)
LKNSIISIWGKVSPIRNLIRKKWFTFLLYHRIDPNLFEQHLEYLQNQYNIIHLDVLRDHYQEKIPLPENALFITFDDGWKSNYELTSIIEEYEIPITIFLSTGFLGTNRKPAPINVYKKNFDEFENFYLIEPERTMLNLKEIKEMSKIVNFQSHGITHSPSTYITIERFKSELFGSKETIERITGKSVYAFAYPYNIANEETGKIVASCGYSLARVGGRKMNKKSANPYLINCIGVDEKDLITDLRRRLLRSELKTILSE